MENAFSITRYPNPLDGRTNDAPDQFCSSCDQFKDKGYKFFCIPLIGLESVFVCDECLQAAKTHKFVHNGKPRGENKT